MSKSSSVYTRVEPAIKAQAEQVLAKLGMPMANAINLFLHQIVLQNGLPFEDRVPKSAPLNYYEMTDEQFDAEIQKGYNSYLEGKTLSSEQVREHMQRLYDA